MKYTIEVIPGDGIGPEVINQAKRALDAAIKFLSCQNFRNLINFFHNVMNVFIFYFFLIVCYN